jgi:hypothetical protein
MVLEVGWEDAILKCAMSTNHDLSFSKSTIIHQPVFLLVHQIQKVL